ncbi:MAG TPA: 1-phosphofructokinase [Chloroflexota bacterium]
MERNELPLIVTVTLNPAMDHTLEVDGLRVGEVNRVAFSTLDPGGKGVNVSRVLHELGGRSIAMGFVGGPVGRALEHAINERGIADDFVHIPGNTRTNVMITDRVAGTSTGFHEPGPVVAYRYLEELLRRLSTYLLPDVWLVLAGSVPPGLPADVYREIMVLAHQRRCKVALDTDGEPLRRGLEGRPYLVKPNRRELESLVGRPLPDLQAVVEAGLEIQRGGVTIVVVSMGAEGAVLLGERERWLAVPPRVPVRSPVGAGDSMVAGIVLALARGEPLSEALRLGTAAGAATALTPGTQLCRRADVEALLPSVSLRRLG